MEVRHLNLFGFLVCSSSLQQLLAGTFSVVVMDGITLGRPTCCEPGCKQSLVSTKDRFCAFHQLEGKNEVCCIVGCTNVSRSNHMTCDIPEHVQVEVTHLERTKAAFQFQKRMERSRVAHPKSAEPLDVDPGELLAIDDALEETYTMVGNGAVPSAPDSTTQAQAAEASAQLAPTQPPSIPAPATPSAKKIRAVFGRKRTHNEQIIVTPCGIVVARETFYNAEAIPSIAVRAGEFPPTSLSPTAMPFVDPALGRYDVPILWRLDTHVCVLDRIWPNVYTA